MATQKIKDIIPEFVFAGKNGNGLKKWGGLNTTVKDYRTLDSGQTYSALNWITARDQDHIELRRGQALLGVTRRNISNQHVSGLGVGTLANGNQTPFYTYGQSIIYYNGNDTVEVSTANILPVLANDEDMNIIPYTNLAGSFVYLVSPHSSIYKIPVANPGSVVDQKLNTLIPNFLFGWAKIDQAVFQGMNRYGAVASSRDVSGFYIGGVDQNGGSGGFATVSGVVGTGNGVSKIFTATLPAYTSPSTTPATYLAVTVTDGNETFNDDKCGNLIGSLGGMGVINYVTGVLTVTFNTAPIVGANITDGASWEDATTKGIVDFKIN